MTHLVLYGHPDSGHACKVALALSLARLPYQTVWIDIWADPVERTADFLALSPFAEVPALVMDGIPHIQSGAILLEIASRFRCLGGESASGLRRGREIILWEANRFGMCLPQLKEARRVRGHGFPPGSIEWLKMRYATDCERFSALLNDAPFFHGDVPGIADCAVWGYGQWIEAAGVTAIPIMRGWLDRMQALAGMKSPTEFFLRKG